MGIFRKRYGQSSLVLPSGVCPVIPTFNAAGIAYIDAGYGTLDNPNISTYCAETLSFIDKYTEYHVRECACALTDNPNLRIYWRDRLVRG